MKFLFAVCSANISATYVDAAGETQNKQLAYGSASQSLLGQVMAQYGGSHGFQLFAAQDDAGEPLPERVEVLKGDGTTVMVTGLDDATAALCRQARTEIEAALAA